MNDWQIPPPTLAEQPDGVELQLAADALSDAAADHQQQARECESRSDADGASEHREFAQRFAALARWLRSL